MNAARVLLLALFLPSCVPQADHGSDTAPRGLAHPSRPRKPAPVSPVGEGCWSADDGMPIYSPCDVWWRLCGDADQALAIYHDPVHPSRNRSRWVTDYELQSLCLEGWRVCLDRDARGLRNRWPATLPWDDGSGDAGEGPGAGWVAVVPPVDRFPGLCD